MIKKYSLNNKKYILLNDKNILLEHFVSSEICITLLKEYALECNPYFMSPAEEDPCGE